ncbi:CofH family radical SAM protein [Pontibacter sp. G13]|uniref:CofH family radical SAM protein n=1 Tax=Pontibacter sp. G13 TaxID=3074898 RepID=UPI00288B38B1|nr:CofH family radical SAM protein [Pontibacter sp. G13]WNJ21313.1 CofH family radical SAM protein [Pontibacter sp. G13]
MNTSELLKKALNFEFLTMEEGIHLHHHAGTDELMFIANEMRKIHKKDTLGIVTWQIDRNVNTTNVCVANCKFCNFFVPPTEKFKDKAYITDDETYQRKAKETFALGGDQFLLQGGHHPELGVEYYEETFSKLKGWFPELRLHALGPPEIVHIAELSGISYEETLTRLMAAGMDSMPGAGAEILNDRVRRIISNGKCSGQEWLDVMHVAHKVGLTTSATMMFGHIETIEERFEHLVRIREVQAMRPEGSNGFKAFIPWPYQDDGTLLNRVKGVKNNVSADEYIRMIALSRIMLPNIENIQASWLTVGPEVAQVCLHAGANDLGSIMIEENVVSAAGAPFRLSSEQIQQIIVDAGFQPQLRTQLYEFRETPPALEGKILAV